MAFSQEMPTALLLADMENETKKKKKKNTVEHLDPISFYIFLTK